MNMNDSYVYGESLLKEVYKQRYRIALSDTDYLRVTYFANYLKFAEKAWMEFLSNIGFSYAKLIHEYKIFIPAVEVNEKILSSAKIDDVIEVSIFIEELGRTYIRYNAKIWDLRLNKLVSEISIRAVCTDDKLESVKKIPKEFIEKIEAILKEK